MVAHGILLSRIMAIAALAMQEERISTLHQVGLITNSLEGQDNSQKDRLTNLNSSSIPLQCHSHQAVTIVHHLEMLLALHSQVLQ